ncbi:general secretion pathway protein GspB [Pseudoalteromonas sp. YIC-656]|uniref:general secretion pathway protein GspB n=1 Tax=Pseudoalteromonas pernae TaxID=3118054 RepID=UPI0032420E80
MSLLLDAMKQSQNTSETSEPESFEQQQALYFYRRLSLALVAILGVIAVLCVGYFAGKWWQNQAPKSVSQPVVADVANAQPSAVDPINSPSQEAPVASVQSNPPVTQTAQGQINPNAVQMPAQYAQPYQQMVPVYVMPQMPQAYGPGTYMQWVPAYGNPMMANQMPANAMQYQANQYAQQPVDMSQYKVVGKPMNERDYQSDYQAQSESPIYDDPALNGVSNDLKRAFADAVAATENMDNMDTVSTTTQAGAMIEPIELLPDSIQGRIPALVYQAHIYATDEDKRWIKLNGYELYEGDTVGRLKVIEITPEKTILRVDNVEFSLQAMQDWP